MKHKKLFISLTAVLTVIVFFGIFFLIWFCGDSYDGFDRFKAEFEIPGLDDGAVPQGMTSCTAEYYVTNDEGATQAIRAPFYFVSAYMSDGSPSRIYVVRESRDGNESEFVNCGYVTLKNENGEDFYGHCGGIAVNNSVNNISSASNAKNFTLWVTGENEVHVAKCSDDYANVRKTIAQEIIDKAMRVKPDWADENGEFDFSVRFTSSFKANCRASFCYYYDDPSTTSLSNDRLYVGEFYRPGNYETDLSHRLTTDKGYLNTAFMYEYNVRTNSVYGLETLTGNNNNNEPNDEFTEVNNVPKIMRIFSLPEQVQGVAWSGRTRYGSNDGLLLLSQSYGLANSHILCFDFSKVMATANRATYLAVTGRSFGYDGVKRTVGGQEMDYTDSAVYVYYVDKADDEMLVKDYSIPSMSEGMCSFTPFSSNSNSPVSRVYVLFESGSKKYKLFVREKLTRVYSFIPRAD